MRIFILILILAQKDLVFSTNNECFKKECCHLNEKHIKDMTCYNGKGVNYRGTENQTNTNMPCINWRNTPSYNMSFAKRVKLGVGDHNFCRNPDPDESDRLWCFVSAKSYGYCSVSKCADKLVSDEMEPVELEFCNQQEPNKTNHPGIVYSDGDALYYVTKHRGVALLASYIMYKFDDMATTSLNSSSPLLLETIFNLCLSNDDVITFMTSDNLNRTYLFVQRINSMLRLDITRRGWEKVGEEVFRDCVNPVLDSARIRSNKQFAVQHIFDFNRPKVLILITKTHEFECVWRKNVLELTDQREIETSTCYDSAFIFANRQNASNYIFIKNQQDWKNQNTNEEKGSSNSTRNCTNQREDINFLNNSYTLSNKAALEIKPGLTGLLLGYEIVNRHSLVKLYNIDIKNKNRFLSNQHCPQGGDKSKIFKISNGQRLLDFMNWIRNKGEISFAIDINYFSIYQRNFCGNTKLTCCQKLQKQLQANKVTPPNRYLNLFNPTARCQLNNASENNCPDLVCKPFNIDSFELEKIYVVCQIELTTSQHEDFSLSAILGVSRGSDIHYLDANDAAFKIGRIVESLYHQTNQTKQPNLGLILGSIKALQPVNYTKLSSGKTSVFIENFLTLVDNLADGARVGDWVALKRNNKASRSLRKRKKKSNTDRNPQSLLLITEKVLERITSQSNVWKKPDKFMFVKTKNVVSVLKQNFLNGNTSEVITHEGVDIEVLTPAADQDSPATLVVSYFPDILQMISKVNKEIANRSSFMQQQIPYQDTEFVSDSPVISASVEQNQKKLSSFVRFNLSYSRKNLPKPQENKKKVYLSCSYLTDNGSWETKGCKITPVPHEDSVTCSCNHTTNFAIILQVKEPELSDADRSLLTLFSYIGESLSVICLILTATVMAVFRQTLKSDRIVVHFNLVISLAAFHLVQLFSYNAESYKNVSPVPCITVAYLSHFFLLASFMWMLCEGITLHFSVLNVFSRINHFKIIRFALGWGFPLLISSGTLAYGLNFDPYPTCYLQGVGEKSCEISGEYSNSLDELDPDPQNQLISRCWLSVDNYLMWTVLLPVLSVLMINFILLVRVSLVIAKSSKKADQVYRPSYDKKHKDFTHLRKSLKGVVILMPILGVPWIFGTIPQSKTHVAVLYTFTLLNSLQGVFILLFYCILNNEVKSVVLRCIRKHTYFNQPQTSSTLQTNLHRQPADLHPKSEVYVETRLLTGHQTSSSSKQDSDDLQKGSPQSDVGKELENCPSSMIKPFTSI